MKGSNPGEGPVVGQGGGPLAEGEELRADSSRQLAMALSSHYLWWRDQLSVEGINARMLAGYSQQAGTRWGVW